ncbi:MAG: peptidylprolyl isomerase [Rhizobiaceae bacterium]
MVTLIKDPFLTSKKVAGSNCSPGNQDGCAPMRGYNGYVEPDTKIPPKAKLVIKEISVNGVPVSESNVLNEAQNHPASNPGEALRRAAHALVIRELLLQKARRLNIVAAPLVGADNTLETEEDALIRQLIEREIDTPISDKSIRQRYYEMHKHRFKSETILEARHILLACRTDNEAKANLELAQSLINRLKRNPQDFGKYAKEYSACPSKNEGGNLGQLTGGSTVPEFEIVLHKMNAGQIWPEPVESRFGLHIIYLVNIIPGEVLPFDYVEDKIGAWLEASSWSKAVSQYVSILAGQAKITGIDLDATSSPLVQ